MGHDRAVRHLAPARAALALCALALFLPAPALAAPPEFLWTSCDGGPEDTQCSIPRGIATNPENGRVFVGDQGNRRVVEFNAWGEFVKTWGWDVVESGPGDDTTPPEDQFEICTPADGDVCKAGIEGGGGGQIGSPQGIAVDSAGSVYVADTGNDRIQQFDSKGNFLRMWGGDVVATGPGDKPTTSEAQSVTVQATSGTFTLGFQGQATAPLTFDAPAASVEAALEALSTIGGAGGGVSVTGGPGDATGSSPYAVTFQDALGGFDLTQLTIDASALGIPVGTVLTCAGGPTGGDGATTVAYRWLSNGVPAAGAGATTPTYTVDPSDAGKALQCQVTATHTAGSAPTAATQVSNPRLVVSSAPSPTPPLAPSGSIAAPTGSATVAANKLTCATGTWAGATSFAFQWYRNGVALAGNGANTGEYTLQAADLASAASFQCAVTGSNSGGSVTKVSQNRVTAAPAPVPSPAAPAATSTVTGPTSATATTTNGVAVPEVCVAADGDACKAGVQGTANGQFGALAVGDLIAIDSNATETDADDVVYVGDQNRIQRFDSDGAYQGEIALPGETVKGLATDSAGDLYAIYENKPNVRKLSPATGEPLPPVEGFRLKSPTAINPSALAAPTAVAVDSEGSVFAFGPPTVEGFLRDPIFEFDPAGNQVAQFGKGEYGTSSTSTGLATNLCPGSAAPGNLYVSNPSSTEAFLRAYGTGPLGCGAPPPRPPQIDDQYALSAHPDGALVGAKINPHFIEDATYFVEYGTGVCAAGGCEGHAPAGAEAALGGGQTGAGAGLTTPPVSLAGLSPETTYHFRFVAKSSGGGPVYGIDPDGKGEGEASFAAGLEASFTTPPAPPPPKTDCPNQAFRSGPSANLADCRAFELVSPLDKNGSGIETELTATGNLVHAALDQSSGDGEGLAYSSKQAFGDALGSPYSSQYIASRDPVEGWSTHGINAPLEPFPGPGRQGLDTEFKAFSEDLSDGWLVHEGEPPLAPCAPPDSPDLYRRDNTADSYEALHCEANKPELGEETIELQGVSADGCHAVFRSDAKLTADANPAGPYQLYESSCAGPLRLVSVLPGGTTACAEESSAGSSLAGVAGALGDGRTRSVQSAFSADAKRLYWSCGETIYLRSDPDPAAVGEPGEEAVKVAGPFCFEEKCTPPRFQGASADGARALYTAFSSNGFTFFLRAYDAATKTSAAIAGGLDPVGGRVELLGASEDATRAYLVSKQVLSAAENSEGDKAIAGQPNLYLHQAGIGFSFIGTLSGADLGKTASEYSPVHPLRFRRASRVSPDGLHAAFISSAPLTGYDNTDATSGEADAEVFLYDAVAGGGGVLRCISCNQTGARPSGRVITSSGNPEQGGIWAAAWIPGWQTQLYQGRPLSEDGNRLFFNSTDALVTRDTNAKQDVYQWERAGSKAQCLEEKGAELYVLSAGGCLSLVSSGQSPEDSEFVDADVDGSDVFLRTGESLLASDPGLTDIYDARAGGGFASPVSEFPLTLETGGSGSGTVQCEVEGGPAEACAAEYPAGTELTLLAEADPGSTFTGWSGACSGTGACELTMDEPHSATATFDLEPASEFPLTLSTTGGGSGTVQCEVEGGPAEPCATEYPAGTEVTLTATAEGSSIFTGWSGACAGAGACEVTMSEAKAVSANFAAGFTLTVTPEGSGAGTVASNPAGISCGAECSAAFEKETVVTLTASPAPGSVLLSWKGCGSVNGRQCTVTMSAAKEVKAKFTTTYDLTVEKTAASTGLGKVSSSPGGVLCLANCTSTTAAFKEGTAVKLTPAASKGSEFSEWSGACSGSGACEVTSAGEAKTVEAKFTAIPKFALTLSKAGGGSGTVKSLPAGINCGATCSSAASSFYKGTEVELTATLGKGSAFGGWSVGAGTCTGTTSPCKVTMSAAKAVTAEFK